MKSKRIATYLILCIGVLFAFVLLIIYPYHVSLVDTDTEIEITKDRIEEQKLLFPVFKDLLNKAGLKESSLLQSLASYCAKSQAVRGVISYNWDNLFERQLKEIGIKVSPLWKSKQDYPQDTLPIYYPHGYLPLEGGPVTKIVLAESDYH